MRNKNRTLLNVFAALITFGVQMFISFWLSPFVVGKLGEEAYGFLNLANNFVAYASLVAVAINSMACRYISVEYNSGKEEEAKKYFCSVFIANCILYATILVISVIFIINIQIFLNVSEELVFQVKLTFLFSFINMGVSLIGTVYTAATFTTGLMHYNSAVQIISNIVRSVLILTLFVVLPPKIFYLSIATLISGLVTLLGNYYLTKKLLKNFDIKIQYFEFSKLIKLVKSGVWLLISNISNLLLNGLDLLLSNWYISSVIMGRLSLAKQIPFALSNALGIFSNIFSSSLTKVFAQDGKRNLIDEANSQMKILAVLFTVPYAGIIVFGKEFISLWLRNTAYSPDQKLQIYILMLLVLVDIITSTYMYSIHSVFIALDKVKKYSVVLFSSSCISILMTIFLLKTTNLGVYAIAGTSTIVLGITHGLIVPAIAAKLLNEKIYLFWKTEGKSWLLLMVLSGVFFLIKSSFTILLWSKFLLLAFVCGFIGYPLSLFIILQKAEKDILITVIKRKFFK